MKNIKKIVIASHNQGKISETIQEIQIKGSYSKARRSDEFTGRG